MPRAPMDWDNSMKPISLCFTIFDNYLYDLNLEVWVGSLISYLEPFGISSGLTRVTLSRMFQQGWVSSRRVGQKSYYRMSDKGKKRILSNSTRLFGQEEKHWDRNWQIVACDFTDVEKERCEAVTREFERIGFGYLGRSTWISPFEQYGQLKMLVDEYDLQNQVHIFSGAYEGMGSFHELIDKAWDVSGVNAMYQLFLDKFGQKFQHIHKLGVQNLLTETQAFVERTLLVREFYKLLFIDPHLPHELLPTGWVGEQARKLFRDYYEFVSPLAEKFFYNHLESTDS